MKRMIFFIGAFCCINILFFSQNGYAVEDNSLTVENFSLLIRKDGNSKAEPLRNVKVNIYGVNSETSKQVLLNTTISDSNGTVHMDKIIAPMKIDQVHFQYYYGNDDRGYITDLNSNKYNANHTRQIPENRITNTVRTTSILGNTISAEMYFKLTNINNIYEDVYQNQKLAVESVKPYINTDAVSFKPINIIYDSNSELLGGSFNRYGFGDKIKEPVIFLSTKNVVDFKSAIAHEWAHWNMYRVNGMPGGSYSSHYDSVNPYVSYKEGWALFQRHRYTCGLRNELVNEVQVQNDDRLYGFSTNFTVKGILYDIYDINFPENQKIENDYFDIYSVFVNGNHSDEDKDLLSEGIMYTLMVNSKASTFQEFYNYLMNTHVLNNYDQTLKGKLEEISAINGINNKGEFIYANKVRTIDNLDSYDAIEEAINDDE